MLEAGEIGAAKRYREGFRGFEGRRGEVVQWCKWCYDPRKKHLSHECADGSGKLDSRVHLDRGKLDSRVHLDCGKLGTRVQGSTWEVGHQGAGSRAQERAIRVIEDREELPMP